MRNDYCVYTHLRPDDSIFYVGKGIPTRPYRVSGRNNAWKQEVAICGKHSVNVVKANLTEKEAFDVEVRLIKMLRDRGVSIVNMTRGGDGCKQLIFTDEVREKIKAARSKQIGPATGKKWSNELKVFWRNQRTGEKNPMYGKKHTEETKAKYKFRPLPVLLERTCPHCGKQGKGGSMIRWHMDNCKNLVVI
jgi:hypothetical protein